MRNAVIIVAVIGLLVLVAPIRAASPTDDQQRTKNQVVEQPKDVNVQRTNPPAAEIRPKDEAGGHTKDGGGNYTPPPSPSPSPDRGHDNYGGDRGNYGDHEYRGHHYGEPWFGGDYWGRGHYQDYWSFPILPPPVLIPYPVTVAYPVAAPTPLTVPWRGYRVCIIYAGNDIVGTNFVNAIRDYLQASGVTLVGSPDDAALELYIASADADPVHSGYGSMASVSYIWFPGDQFLTSQIMNVGALQVGPQASSVATYAQQLIAQYRS